MVAVLRVLIAHNRYRHPGGEETHVDLLERGLAEAGVEVRRFERSSSELEGSPACKLGATLGLAYRPSGGGIRRALREWRPDVVHFHNIWPLLTPAALREAKRSGAAVVLTAHNYRFACPGGTLLRDGAIHEDCIEGSSLVCGLRGARESRAESIAYGLALEIQRRTRMLERWADAFVAPSDFMRGMLARSGLPAQRIHVIHNGIELPPPPPADREPGRRFALFAGRLAPEKGIRALLAAAEHCPEVPIAIAGDGALAEEVARSPLPNVRYLGSLGRQEVERAMSAAAFTACPSESYDNLPLAALESFGAGRAVLAAPGGRRRRTAVRTGCGLRRRSGFRALQHVAQKVRNPVTAGGLSLGRADKNGLAGTRQRRRDYDGAGSIGHRSFRQTHSVSVRCFSPRFRRPCHGFQQLNRGGISLLSPASARGGETIGTIHPPLFGDANRLPTCDQSTLPVPKFLISRARDIP